MSLLNAYMMFWLHDGLRGFWLKQAEAFKDSKQPAGYKDMSALAFLDGQCLLLRHNPTLHRS